MRGIPRWYFIVICVIALSLILIFLPTSQFEKPDEQMRAVVNNQVTSETSGYDGESNIDAINKQIEEDNKNLGKDTGTTEYTSDITPVAEETSIVKGDSESTAFIDSHPDYESLINSVVKSNFESYFNEYAEVNEVEEGNLYKNFVIPEFYDDFSMLYAELDTLDSRNRNVYIFRNITLAKVLSSDTLLFFYNVDGSTNNNLLAVKYVDTSDISIAVGEETAVSILDLNLNKVQIDGETVLFGVH